MASLILMGSAKMALKRLDPNAGLRDGFEQKLQERFVGHPEVVSELARSVRRHEAGLSAPNHPAAIYLAVGPTGSGKTHCVNSFGRVLTGSDPLRIDCGEYIASHESARLTGAPSGYIGHRETQPLLAQAMLAQQHTDKNKNSVVLFDEIDKAHPRMLDLMLGIFDSGKLRLGDNAVTDFTNTFIFLTSNTGAKQMQEALNATFGFNAGAASSQSSGRIAQAAVKKVLRPEMYNRLTKVLTFDQLTQAEVAQVAVMEIAKLEERLLRGAGVGLMISSEARAALAAQGYEPRYGARHLNRVLERQVIEPVSNLIVSGQLQRGQAVMVDITGAGTYIFLST